MGYRQTIALLFTAGIAAAADRECDLVMNRATEKIRAQFHSMSAYTCMQTVQREYFMPRGSTLNRECGVLMELRKHRTPDLELMLSARDRLRLEVAISTRGEIQAWPGASRFVDAGIDTLVRSGPIGTGAFGTLLNLIFTTDAKTFRYTGDSKEGGHRYLVYNFSVRLANSHYRVKAQDGSDWITVPYEGVILLDAETADPFRLTVITNDLPLATNVCQTATTLAFVRDEGLAAGLLIPATAGQRFVGPNGIETQNNTTFSSCHQYASESTISYFTPPDEPAPAKRAKAKLAPEMPTAVPFSMELLTTIDSDTSAAGDRFTARLVTPIRDGRRLIAPKGARIEGRVSRVETGLWPRQAVVIGLTPESIELQGARAPFGARLDLRPLIVAKEQKQRKGLQFYLPDPGELPHEFRFPGTHSVLASGFTSEWITVPPPPQRLR